MTTPSDNMRGIIGMVAATTVFFVNDLCVKLSSRSLPLGEILLVRGMFATAGGVLIMLLFGRLSDLLRVGNRYVAIRLVMEVLTTLFYIAGLLAMPVAEAIAVYQITPLASTAAAALFLREQVGWRRWSAILVGFIGVMIVLRPGGANFNHGAIFVLIAVCCVVVRDLSTSRIPTTVPTFAVSAVTAITIMLLGPLLMPFDGLISAHGHWVMPSPQVIGLLATAGLFLVVGHSLMVVAVRFGELSLTAPFRYILIVWSFLASYFIFDEVPDGYTWLGTAMIMASGLYTIHRARVRARETGRAALLTRG